MLITVNLTAIGSLPLPEVGPGYLEHQQVWVTVIPKCVNYTLSKTKSI